MQATQCQQLEVKHKNKTDTFCLFKMLCAVCVICGSLSAEKYLDIYSILLS